MEEANTGLISRRGVLGAGASAVAAGCAGVQHDRLVFWAMSYEGDYSPLLMPSFTAATGIPVRVQSIPATAAHEKFLTAHAGEALPPVMMLYNTWVAEFAMIGALAPIRNPALLADQFPGVRESIRYAGRDVAVPWAVAPQAQYYRRDMLEAAGYDTPPLRWDDWRTMLTRLKRRAPEEYPVLLLLNWPDQLINFAGQMRAGMLRDQNTRGNFSTPEFRTALAFYKSIFDAGLAPRALSTEVQDPVTSFARGQIAVWPASPMYAVDFAGRPSRPAQIPAALWGTAQFPGPDGPGPLSGTSTSIAVSRAAANDPRAWALLRHLTGPETELRFHQLIGALPARRSAWTSPQLAGPIVAPFREQMKQPRLDPNIVEWERIKTDVQLVAERVVRGQVGIDAATREMDRQTDILLAKRRWLVERGRIA